jgi:hypothetical protein
MAGQFVPSSVPQVSVLPVCMPLCLLASLLQKDMKHASTISLHVGAMQGERLRAVLSACGVPSLGKARWGEASVSCHKGGKP